MNSERSDIETIFQDFRENLDSIETVYRNGKVAQTINSLKEMSALKNTKKQESKSTNHFLLEMFICNSNYEQCWKVECAQKTSIKD